MTIIRLSLDIPCENKAGYPGVIIKHDKYTGDTLVRWPGGIRSRHYIGDLYEHNIYGRFKTLEGLKPWRHSYGLNKGLPHNQSTNV